MKTTVQLFFLVVTRWLNKVHKPSADGQGFTVSQNYHHFGLVVLVTRWLNKVHKPSADGQSFTASQNYHHFGLVVLVSSLLLSVPAFGQWGVASGSASSTARYALAPSPSATMLILNDDCIGSSMSASGACQPEGPVTVPLPVPPDDLQATALNARKIRLFWTDRSPYETEYWVYRSQNAGRFTHLATLPEGTGELEFVDSLGLQADTRYLYIVYAVNFMTHLPSNQAAEVTYPLPPVSVGKNAACSGQVALLEVTGTNKTQGFRWYLNETGTEALPGTSATQEIQRNTTGEQTYYVATIGKRYESQQRTPVRLTYYPLPLARIEGGEERISCEAALLLSAEEEESGVDYFWFEGTQQVGAGTEFLSEKSGTYHLVAQSKEGCRAVSRAVRVRLNFSPQVRLNTDAQTVDFCGTGRLAVQEVEAGTYQWWQDDMPLSVRTPYLDITESGLYQVEVRQYGCSASSVPVRVRVSDERPADTLRLSAEKTRLCPSEQIQLRASDIPLARYEWFRNGRRIEQAQGSQWTTGLPGLYTVVAELPGTCRHRISSQALALTVFDTPDARLRKVGEDSLVVEVLGADTPASIRWFYEGEALPEWDNQRQAQPAAGQEGTYWASVTYPTGCAVFTNSFRYFRSNAVPTGTETLAQDLKLYPNPTDDWVALQIPESWTAEATLYLFDELGRRLLSRPLAKGQTNIRIRLLDYAPGVYVLSLHTEGRIITRKLVRY